MKATRKIIAFGLVFAATAALAHQGVQNPAVKARMENMGVISENMKILGNMAKGKAPFDAAKARAAAARMADHAVKVPDLFEAEENDPKSEALPVIWTSYDDFTSKAVELEAVARALSASIAAGEDMPGAVTQLGAACSACHKVYRE